MIDVSFDEDRCRIRKDNAAYNFAVLKRAALNIINQHKGKKSVASIRRRAGWGDQTMKTLLLTT